MDRSWDGAKTSPRHFTQAACMWEGGSGLGTMQGADKTGSVVPVSSFLDKKWRLQGKCVSISNSFSAN